MYVGSSSQDLLDAVTYRYFYGLRRTDDGELFLNKVDQLSKNDVLQVNNPGLPEENFDQVNEGQDFFEGRDVFHELLYDNLKYEQFRWDSRFLYYYVDEEGLLSVKINEPHSYNENSSSSGE